MIDVDAAARLRELADRARRLPPPSARNPHAFHEARSELANDIMVVAAGLGVAPLPVQQAPKQPWDGLGRRESRRLRTVEFK